MNFWMGVIGVVAASLLVMFALSINGKTEHAEGHGHDDHHGGGHGHH